MAEHFPNELLIKVGDIKKLISNIREFFIELSEMKNKREFCDEWIQKGEKKKNILKFKKEFLNLSNEFNERMAQKN